MWSSRLDFTNLPLPMIALQYEITPAHVLYQVWPANASGVNQRFAPCKILHLKDPVLKITILSTWTDQSEVRNRPRGTSYLIVCRAIRFPYHAIRPPKLPHVSFSVGWRLEAAPGEFGRKPFLSTHNASSSSSQHAYVRGAIHCTTSLLCFLVAKKLTEAADALYGTLLHMFVYSQWWG